jgi:hypothetical protein
MLGFALVRRRAEALVVAGAKGWGWLVGRAFALALVRFVTAASARWVGLGGQVGAAVSPRLANRRRRWGVHLRGGEQKYRWWLEPRGGSGWWVERVACFLVRFVTAGSARWVGLGDEVSADVLPRPASRG